MARDQGAHSTRRSFCWTLAGVLVAPGIAIAQASKVVRRIGRLESGAPLTPEDIRKEVDALREFGWVEGQNLHTERRYANGRFEALQPLAEELVRAKVEVIVTGGTAATRAAMRATKTIPIVFRIADDPVGGGLVASLAHPGGNVTGFSAALPEVNAKYLSVLKELLPGLKRIGVVESRNPSSQRTASRSRKVAARWASSRSLPKSPRMTLMARLTAWRNSAFSCSSYAPTASCSTAGSMSSLRR
jgi:ABC-type uncharacterized transport system substrate-binding protein